MVEPVTATAAVEKPAPAPVAQEFDPAQEAIEVELPAELTPPEAEPEAEPTEKPEAEPPGAKEPAEAKAPQEPRKPAKGRVVPKEALDAERDKRKRATEAYKAAETQRQQYESELARIRAEQEIKKEGPPTKYDELPDLNTVAAKIKEEVQAVFEQRLNAAEAASLRRHVALSDYYFRRENEDYDDVLEKSGVAAAIKIDPATGRPPDPYLWNHIFRSMNPAETAYNYGKGKLSDKTEAEAEIRGEERGRREVTDKVIANASRPRGIAALPSSSASRTGLTRADIDRMSDAQKARLKSSRPDVWRWYLGGD